MTIPRYSQVAILLMLVPTLAVAQDDDDVEESEFTSGWIGTYGDEAGHAVRRVDETIAFQWQTGRADERLAAGSVRVHWEGVLLTRTAGTYQSSCQDYSTSNRFGE